MSTKLHLKEAWDKLNQIAQDYTSLQPSQLHARIGSAIEHLQEAQRRITSGGFKPVYAIGVPDGAGGFGMTHGPSPTLDAMLGVNPDRDQAHLFEFSSDENGQMRERALYVWGDEHWVECPF